MFAHTLFFLRFYNIRLAWQNDWHKRSAQSTKLLLLLLLLVFILARYITRQQVVVAYVCDVFFTRKRKERSNLEELKNENFLAHLLKKKLLKNLRSKEKKS